ncbi:MAG: hypothetical protein A3J83_08510 [Elusimicrobia bacterium RIFOXYA2_FULL_40_6]|nr:MAG: hypothetical protein A3J83_08510 [Elusimicrobia bacterium RIFOXYA2_FULL_40_6]
MSKEPKHFLYQYHPELKEYLQFHDTIDRFAWMLKLRFSPASVLKSKKYRIDELFQYFLKELNYDAKKIRNLLVAGEFSKEKFKFHMLQGWYNEIAFGFPYSQNFDISSSVTYKKGDFETELFPSWKIIKCYYSIYSYFTALIFTENKNIQTIEHRKSSTYFNRHQLSKYSKIILKFPFNIYYKKGISINESFLDTTKREWKYKYSQCPRNCETIYDLEKEFRADLRKMYLKETNDHDVFTILDILYKFRIWSNYQGINTITHLKQGGLLMFLERNLYTINFFIAGITELIAIALLGENEFTDTFKGFYSRYIKSNDLLYEKWHKIPQIVRYKIYTNKNILNLLDDNILPPNRNELNII